MQTAYIAEVDTGINALGTRYIGLKGKLVPRPYFFRNSTTIRAVLEGKRGKHYGFIVEKHLEKTEVIMIKNLEKGLRASEATRMTAYAFLATKPLSKTRAPKNTVYRIELSPGSSMWQKGRPYVGSGKFGTTWQRAGDVRLHLNNNLDRLTANGSSGGRAGVYAGAQVVSITLGPDGIHPVAVTRTPIIDWYIQSQKSRVRWHNHTSTSLGDWTPDPRWERRL